MNWKNALIVGGLILFLGVVGAAVWKIVQRTESQKAEKIVNYNYDFHPAFGCMRVPSVVDKK